ncbi:hypothetical protein E5676_scaffold142G002800 [Cucumis melo var. makuwa]|uniref:Retrotransposon protein n=1 Tax=Cucumis melo var. makuwa TaxID=1194695 RepID=A0A5D3DHY0_CUCMM|nr:hypothetical protein E5676_scaffold142G002800 [Cucumis melo var. makuwa]
MAGLSRNPKHPWTKAEEICIIDCLVDLVNAGDTSYSKRTPQLAFPALRQVVRLRERLHNGAHAVTFADIGLNMSGLSDDVQPKDGLDMEFPNMCSPEMSMSLEDMMAR